MPLFEESDFGLLDPLDNSKRVVWNVAALLTGTTVVLTPPPSSGVLAVLGLAQSWAATQSFSGTGAGDKAVVINYDTSLADPHELVWFLDANTGYKLTLIGQSYAADVDITFPVETTVLAGCAVNQIFTGNNTWDISGGTANTHQVNSVGTFVGTGLILDNGSGFLAEIQVNGSIASDQYYELPAGGGALVTNTSTNSLSNKTMLTFTMANGANVVINTSTGTKIGTGTTQKIAFHNSTPVVQRAGAAQDAVATTSATNTTPYGFTTAAQADAIVTLVNELRAALVEKGLIKGSA